MIDAAVVFIIALAFFGCYASYRFGMGRGRMLERREVVQVDTCPCGHAWGAHKDGGKCRADIRRRDYDVGIGYEWVPCPCHKYHGPPVISELIDPPKGLGR